MPVSEIRFTRLHITEETARAAAMNDYAAFKAEFPDVTIPANPKYKTVDELNGVVYAEGNEYREYIVRDRYADSGLIGCIIIVQVDTGKAPGAGGWLQRLFQAKLIEGNPLRQ